MKGTVSRYEGFRYEASPSRGMKVLGMKGTVSRYEGSPSRGMKHHRLEV